MSRRYCANCGELRGAWARWCGDCWCMVIKTVLSQLAAAGLAWLVRFLR